MVAIFSPNKSQRLNYVLKLLFEELIQIEYKLFHDAEAFALVDMPKICYGEEARGEVLFIPSAGLLFEKDIREQQIELASWNDLKVLFPVKYEGADFPFDPFAMIFYLASRYEEYLPGREKDVHGRFKVENSILFQSGMLKRPVIDLLADGIKKLIQEKYPHYKFPEKAYSFTPSYDIDMAFAYLGKGFLRTIGGFARLFLKLQPKQIRGRVRTLLGLEQDPFDNFYLQKEIHRELGLRPLYFVNLGDYSRFDKNVSHRNENLRKLLKTLSEEADLGIHPSYYSNDGNETLAKEKARLEEITGKEVSKSRQHFLKLDLPETYRNLISLGIQDDYSMGYASQIGFRAGIASAFRFYDLPKEEITSLRIHPFGFMDTSFLDYLDMKSDEIPAAAEALILEAKKLQIPLMAIWHNYALADDTGRINAYRQILRMAVD